MTNTLRLKTNLNCNSCVAAVRPYLDREPSISNWQVDITAPEKTLTVEGDSVSTDNVKAAVAKAGFQVLGEIAAPQHHSTQTATAESAEQTSYYPLFLLATFLIGLVLLIELRMGSFVWSRAMQNFMGAFFITFSFFKLLDLRGFADSYRMYDVVAKRLPAYAVIYPFIELALGVAYVTGVFPFATNAVTLVVMSVSSIGVIQSLLDKRKIRCACLGAVFNLPMSTVTLVEDALMVVMAAAMLIRW
ncbi:MAG: heavy-metal-associated domain-containing protein [Planctomycetaceae bacterium]|nr:heavy-metal-associated domain-containing protein [Planctomycetaceae bacterium]